MKTSSQKKKAQLLNRKSFDPNLFHYTGEENNGKIDIQLFKYNNDNFVEKKEIEASKIEDFDDNSYIYWLNTYGLSDTAAIASICKKLQIHNLTIQDILDVNQRPKFQEFDDFCFLTIKSTLPSEKEINTEQISFVIGKNYLISFQEKKADYFDHLRFRLRENSGVLRQKRSDYLLYTLLESILDNYFKTLDHLGKEIDNTSIIDYNEKPSPIFLEAIENNKKLVNFIKKAILPIKEFSLLVEREESSFIEKNQIKYFNEIKDLCLTLLDTCDTLLASLESRTNLFFYVQGDRMNQVMKTLTVIATIFIPLTFIAGIYGMNFSNIPELSWKHGYISVWVVFFMVVIAMVVYFRKKKWF